MGSDDPILPTKQQTKESLRLLKAFERINDGETRQRIIEDAEKAALKEEGER